jgi:hypothetical protein
VLGTRSTAISRFEATWLHLAHDAKTPSAREGLAGRGLACAGLTGDRYRERLMTTYRYKLPLDDSEMIALQAAITHYRDVCQQEIPKESGAPYWAHNEALQRISLKPRGDAAD